LSKAYVLFSCESGSDNYIVSNLKTIETVREAYGTFGIYDVIAKIESDSDDKLNEIITKKFEGFLKLVQIGWSLPQYSSFLRPT